MVILYTGRLIGIQQEVHGRLEINAKELNIEANNGDQGEYPQVFILTVKAEMVELN